MLCRLPFLLQNSSLTPPTIAEGDTTYIPYANLPASDTYKYENMQANLPFDCMGDASGVYAVTKMFLENTFSSDETYTVRVKNYGECGRLSNDDLNPDGVDDVEDPEKICTGYGNSDWQSDPSMYPFWTPTEVCNHNYNLPSTMKLMGDPFDNDWSIDTMDSDDFDVSVTFQSDGTYKQHLRDKRDLRRLVMAHHDAAAANTSASLAACNSTFHACHGQPECFFSGCVAKLMQFSCVDAEEYAVIKAGGVGGGLVLMFGSKKVRDSWKQA